MEPVLVISSLIFLVASIGLIVAIFIEIREAKKLTQTKIALTAFGEALTTQFQLLLAHVGRSDETMVELSKITNLLQQQQIFVNTIMGLHSEALGLKELPKAIALHEKLQQMEGDDSAG